MREAVKDAIAGSDKVKLQHLIAAPQHRDCMDSKINGPASACGDRV